MFCIKEMTAAFQTRKGLQNSVWYEALGLPVKEQGVRKDRLHGIDVLCIWASLPSPVTPTLG